MQETTQNAFGFAHLWAAGDAISHSVAIILAIMSIASWYLILAKAWDWWTVRRSARAVGQFWAASSVAEGIERLRDAGIDSPYAQLAEQANCCNHDCETVPGRLASRFDPAEQMRSPTICMPSSRSASLSSPTAPRSTRCAPAPLPRPFNHGDG